MTTEDDPSVDLLIRHGYVLTMDGEDRVFPDGAIAVRGREIIQVGDDADLSRRFRPATTIDADGAPVHPGLVETHVHAPYHLYRSVIPDEVAEDDVFSEFTRRYLDTVTEEEEFLAVQLAAIEMIRNGTTCFMEAGSVFAPNAAALAAETVGIRAVIADPFIMDSPEGFIWDIHGGTDPASHPSPEAPASREPQNLDQAIAGLGHQLWRNSDENALVTGSVALRGLGTASPDLIVHAKRLADEHGAILNMHQSYNYADRDAVQRMFGTDPLVGLERLGVLDDHLLLGHANLLTDDEVAALLRSGTAISWAPAASMVWGHRSAFESRHAEIWTAGGSVGLGSDSSNWSNSFDMFRQAGLAVLVSRTIRGDRGALGAADAMRIATVGGARAIGLGDRIGSLTPGRRADIVIHSRRTPELVPATDPLRNLIYSSGSKSVHTVIVDGRVVLREGSFSTIDEGDALDNVNAAARAMFARIGYTVRRDRPQRV